MKELFLLLTYWAASEILILEAHNKQNADLNIQTNKN